MAEGHPGCGRNEGVLRLVVMQRNFTNKYTFRRTKSHIIYEMAYYVLGAHHVPIRIVRHYVV